MTSAFENLAASYVFFLTEKLFNCKSPQFGNSRFPSSTHIGTIHDSVHNFCRQISGVLKPIDRPPSSVFFRNVHDEPNKTTSNDEIMSGFCTIRQSNPETADNTRRTQPPIFLHGFFFVVFLQFGPEHGS